MKAQDLTNWRKQRGLTQKRLAELLGVKTFSVSRWETGNRGIPTLLELALLGLEQILKEEEEKKHGKDQEVN